MPSFPSYNQVEQRGDGDRERVQGGAVLSNTQVDGRLGPRVLALRPPTGPRRDARFRRRRLRVGGGPGSASPVAKWHTFRQSGVALFVLLSLFALIGGIDVGSFHR